MKKPSKKLTALAASSLMNAACASSLSYEGMTPVQPLSVSAESATNKRLVYLPGYEVRKRIAVLLNGSSERDHLVEVAKQIEGFQKKGFEKIFVASNQDMPEGDSIVGFPGTPDGFNKLFTTLKDTGKLKEHDLLFVQVGGHGGASDGQSCIAVDNGDCYKQEDLIRQLEFVKKARAKLLFFSGGCSSGSYPNALMKAGFEGVAMASSKTGENSLLCFQKAFSQAFREGYDYNEDNISEPSDWFQKAKRHVKINHPEAETEGEYNESHPELTLDNLETILQLNKKIIVEVTMPGCKPCERLKLVLKQVSGSNGTDIKVVTLTNGVNPDFEKIAQRLGISEEIKNFPELLIKYPGDDKFYLQDDDFYYEKLANPKAEEGKNRGVGVRMTAGTRASILGGKGAVAKGPEFVTGIEVVSRKYVTNISGQIDVSHAYMGLCEEKGEDGESTCTLEKPTSLRAELSANGGAYQVRGFFERSFDPGITSFGLMIGGGIGNSAGPVVGRLLMGGGAFKVDEWDKLRPGVAAAIDLRFATPFFGDSYDLDNKLMFPSK